MTFITVFVVALVATLFLTPRVIAWAQRVGALDVPHGEQKEVHTRPTPRLGGLAIFPAFALAVALTWLLPVERQDSSELARTLGLLAGAVIIFALGLWDDTHELPPGPQFAILIAGAALPVLAGVQLMAIPNLLGGEPIVLPASVAFALTLFWIVGAANTVNWIDGLDGLASGVVAIAAVILALRTYFLGQESVALLPLALLACCLGFLFYNRHPARIFLGGGAYLLGYLIGAISLFGGPKSATLLLVLAVPIIDVAWIIVNRVRQRHLPVYGDRSHLHHRLFDLGLTQPRVVMMYYGVAIFFGLLAVALPSAQTKFVALAATVLAVLVILYRLSRRT